jgi:glycosyltransferase involved in cell wall biosynthesis
MNENGVKVSVIVPVHNAEATLARCLDSLLAQTLEAIEIVVIDDGSSDGSPEIIREYAAASGKITAMRQENAGAAAARNRGFRHAAGPYIGFTDSDDYAAPTLYEKLYSEITDKAAQLAVCTRYSLTEQGMKEVGFSPRLTAGVYDADTADKFGVLFSNLSVFIWDKLFDASIIAGRRLRFPEGRDYGEDFCFLAKYLRSVKRAVLVSEPLYCYNAVSEGSVTNSISEDWYHIYENLLDVIAYYRDDTAAQGDSGYAAIKPYLRDICIRYYDRRVNALHKHGDKGFQLAYLADSFLFLDTNFPDWKSRMKQHPDVIGAGIKTNAALMRLYILAPNALKRAYIARKTAEFELRNS